MREEDIASRSQRVARLNVKDAMELQRMEMDGVKSKSASKTHAFQVEDEKGEVVSFDSSIWSSHD